MLPSIIVDGIVSFSDCQQYFDFLYGSFSLLIVLLFYDVVFTAIATSIFCTSSTVFEWLYTSIISWSLDLEDGFYPAFTTAFLHRSGVMPFIARESWKDFIPAGDTRLQILIYSYNVLFDGPGGRLFSLHCRLPFAPFLITNLIMGDATLLLFHYFPLAFVLYFASLFARFLLATSRRTLSYFHIGEMLVRVFETKGNTRLHLKRSLIFVIPFYLSLPLISNYFERSFARTFVFGWKMLAFFLPFTFHKCRFSSSLPLSFYLLPVVRPSFLRFTGYRRTFCGRPWLRERAFTTRPCANVFHVFKVWCSYVDSLPGISAGNILKFCF